jgi:hypothetical protein
MSNLYYYILLDPDKPNHCKVGITKNLKNRLRAYRTASPNCSFFYTCKLHDIKHEKRILDILSDTFTVRSEYVHCNPHIVKNIVESYFDDLK